MKSLSTAILFYVIVCSACIQGKGGVLPRCSQPLGMEQNTISNDQITSNSVKNSLLFGRWDAWKARLNNRGAVNAWMPHHDGNNQYLQVDFGTVKAISGIITQGAKRYLRSQYVTQFKISYGKRETYFAFIKDGKDDVVFSGNKNSNGHKRNMFPKVILARYIRFVPQRWRCHITVRLEYLGCDLDTYDNAVQEAEGGSTPTVGVIEP